MLSALDWFILIILLGGLIRGYTVGAVRQIGSLVGLVAALLVSVEFMESVGGMVVASIGLSESLAPLAGFTVLFVGVYLLFVILSRLVEQVFESLSLSFVNRAAGGAVGSLKAALLLSLLFLVLGGLEMPDKQTRRQSAFYRPVARLLPQAIEVTERWFPAAKKAADQLGQQVRSRVESVPNARPSSEAGMGTTDGCRPGALASCLGPLHRTERGSLHTNVDSEPAAWS
ncbi:MAG: CvpA family protein [Salinibacter sp.]